MFQTRYVSCLKSSGNVITLRLLKQKIQKISLLRNSVYSFSFSMIVLGSLRKKLNKFSLSGIARKNKSSLLYPIRNSDVYFLITLGSLKSKALLGKPVIFCVIQQFLLRSAILCFSPSEGFYDIAYLNDPKLIPNLLSRNTHF